MFLGYQNEKIKFYTEQPLDIELYNLTNIEETDEEYVLDGDEYVPKNEEWEQEHFEEVKALKLKEAETKCAEKRYNQTFTVELQEQECEFDTTEQTQRDLLSADSVTSKGLVYPNWVTNNRVTINLTAEDVLVIYQTFFSLISPLYSKQLYYIEQINACTTAEEVEAIVIDYDHLELNEENAEINGSEEPEESNNEENSEEIEENNSENEEIEESSGNDEDTKDTNEEESNNSESTENSEE